MNTVRNMQVTTVELWQYDAKGKATRHAVFKTRSGGPTAMTMPFAVSIADKNGYWVQDSKARAVWQDLYIGGKLAGGCDL